MNAEDARAIALKNKNAHNEMLLEEALEEIKLAAGKSRLCLDFKRTKIPPYVENALRKKRYIIGYRDHGSTIRVNW